MRTLLSTLIVLGSALVASAENWPQWRGPKNDGHSSETGLPVKWDEKNSVVWKIRLPGPGASTPCIWGESIFLTTQEGTDIVVHCITTDGKAKWSKKLGTSKGKPYRNDEGNDASASCSTDGKLVFAFVGSGEVAAYDFEGNKVWDLDSQKKYGEFNIQFGVHQTPVLYKGRLYLSLLHRKAQLLVALDAATGKEIWQHKRQSDGRGESPDVYASPFIWEKGDQALLISHGNDYCTAHKLDNGDEVWRVGDLNPKAKYNNNWRAVSSPLVTPDLIVVPSCKNGVTVGIDPAKAKGLIVPGSPAELWRLPKNTPDVPSPLLVDDLLYIQGEGGVLYCYEAKTGKAVYSEKVTNMRHRANPVYADGKIYLLGRDQSTVVVKPGREFEVLATNKLPDNFAASPAVSGGRVYLRGFENLWAIGAK
ncbi:outer membrane protein assembly factor BamB family protein [Limnoglobus roseus]|uniref:Serine/threonine protein kinase n=1 Tax=Limnoglobus roseus TaxID=2598579 RepID=A0A5C1AAS6_9BACT|nr:PQQ-binding-like beta-propeller repeat protein [Limnoglobus roseus]QEL16489.1 serine/threonine protein kinase [Limnoglobus roseus]